MAPPQTATSWQIYNDDYTDANGTVWRLPININSMTFTVAPVDNAADQYTEEWATAPGPMIGSMTSPTDTSNSWWAAGPSWNMSGPDGVPAWAKTNNSAATAFIRSRFGPNVTLWWWWSCHADQLSTIPEAANASQWSAYGSSQTISLGNNLVPANITFTLNLDVPHNSYVMFYITAQASRVLRWWNPPTKQSAAAGTLQSINSYRQGFAAELMPNQPAFVSGPLVRPTAAAGSPLARRRPRPLLLRWRGSPLRPIPHAGPPRRRRAHR